MAAPPKSAIIGAVDIGGTKIAVGLVDSQGKVRARLEFPTNPDGGFDLAFRRVTEGLRKLCGEMGVEVNGIGVGSTGPVDPLTGAFGNVNFFPAWEGENPVDLLAREFKVDVAMENDADAAALGEAYWGAGRGKRRLVYVTVGTGIGVAIIIDGKLYRGAGGAHPEIGHHVIDASGPLCSCGARGCWETLAAGPAMVTWMQNEPASNSPEDLNLTAKQICELARQGDVRAMHAVETYARYLGLGLANTITFLVPDAIVLGGSVMNSTDLFMEGVRKVVRENCRLVPFEHAELIPAALGPDAPLAGAARVWYHRFAEEDL